jgi:hypothetical protein
MVPGSPAVMCPALACAALKFASALALARRGAYLRWGQHRERRATLA